MRLLATLATMLLCAACATRPAAVETACNWVRPIEVTGDQVAVFSDNMRIMRPLADHDQRAELPTGAEVSMTRSDWRTRAVRMIDRPIAGGEIMRYADANTTYGLFPIDEHVLEE